MKKALYLLLIACLFSCRHKSNSDLIVGTWHTKHHSEWHFREDGTGSAQGISASVKSQLNYKLINAGNDIQISIHSSNGKEVNMQWLIQKIDEDTLIMTTSNERATLIKEKIVFYE